MANHEQFYFCEERIGILSLIAIINCIIITVIDTDNSHNIDQFNIVKSANKNTMNLI